MLKMTSVCGCGWSTDQPKAACASCGQVICPDCGSHTLTVAAWPGESRSVLKERVNAHVRDMAAEIAAMTDLADQAVRLFGYGGDGEAHRH